MGLMCCNCFLTWEAGRLGRLKRLLSVHAFRNPTFQEISLNVGLTRVSPTYELNGFGANVSDYEHHATPLKYVRDYPALHKINRKGISEEELDEHRESPLHKVMARFNCNSIAAMNSSPRPELCNSYHS